MTPRKFVANACELATVIAVVAGLAALVIVSKAPPPEPAAEWAAGAASTHADRCATMCGAALGKCCKKCKKGGADCCCQTPGYDKCSCPPDARGEEGR